MIKITVDMLISFIKIYRLIISPYIAPSCRYLPTCSEYTIDCLRTYGLTKGLFKSMKRILSCHPIKILGGGEGFDPAIKDIKVKK